VAAGKVEILLVIPAHLGDQAVAALALLEEAVAPEVAAKLEKEIQEVPLDLKFMGLVVVEVRVPQEVLRETHPVLLVALELPLLFRAFH
jgi:hypothetical protein